MSHFDLHVVYLIPLSFPSFVYFRRTIRHLLSHRSIISRSSKVGVRSDYCVREKDFEKPSQGQRQDADHGKPGEHTIGMTDPASAR